MEVVNESGSVQAIARDGDWVFFVENDLDDDILLTRLDCSKEEAEQHARLMSIAWDEAIGRSAESQVDECQS